jgi:bifunctional non-homologous end joining protein LigD
MGDASGGKSPKTARQRRARFVIQEHHARALHWDFRLEHDGVLVSWALPRGLPEDPTRNHLAVHTEDHPLEYGSFQGTIPAGEYGGGKVTIWDRGTYDLEKWRRNEVMVVLHGKKASGRYVLFPTDGKNWMIHRMSPKVEGKEPLPGDLQPMLAVPGALPPRDRDWAFEIKWDGIRAIARVEEGRVGLRSRNGKDITRTFPELRGMGEFFGLRPCILDGEIVALGDDGRPDFNRLQHRLQLAQDREIDRRARATPATFVAFDVLHLDGRSLLDLPYDERRAVLESLDFRGDAFTTTESFRDVRGPDLLRAILDSGLEGIVAKRRSSLYRPGRRMPEWIKIKGERAQEVVIGGWTEGKGERSGSLGALLMGIPDGAALQFAGKVGTGFSAEDRQQLLKTLQPLARKTSPFDAPLASADRAGAHFVRPVLVGEVRYGEWTPDQRLRHPSWRGLRPDKDPADVVREV